MTCLTSSSNKTVLLVVLLVAAITWGCSRYTTELSVFIAPKQEPNGAPRVDNRPLITVLPVENLSGTRAPLDDIGRSIRNSLDRKGYRLLDETTFNQFRKKHRMRYTGGVSTRIAQALKDETGADAFLITSLESYNDLNPPQISLISRLVTSGSSPEIFWIDSIGLSGDESPGLLGLNQITAPEILLRKAVDKLTGSMTAYFESELTKDILQTGSTKKTADTPDYTPPAFRWKRKYLPYDFFRSPIIDPDQQYSIAVIPMLDLAVRKNAGNIVSLHYVRELFHLTHFNVIEPGVVREELLRFRAIMPAGPSLAVADLITSPNSLGVDLVLSGRVFDYQDFLFTPKVDFSVQVLEKQSREVVFGARTFNTGDKGVFFFNFGRVFTAHNLLAEMTAITARLLSAEKLPQEVPDELIAQTRKDWNKGIVGAYTVQKPSKDDDTFPFTVVVTNGTSDSDVF